ncbi:MAG: hypothetical protein ACRYGP_28395 [Janthinobacterium lividum]
MNWLLSLVTGGIGSAVSGIIAPILGYATTARNDDLSGFQAGVGADTDRYKALLSAQVEIAQAKASQNMWWGARLLFLAGALGPVVHFTAVFLDSVPLFGHVVGSWSIPRLPAPYDGYEGQIVLSFFILAPAAPVLSAAASWLHRR